VEFSRAKYHERAQQAFRLGEEAQAKGDIEGAMRLFMQADMCDPHDRDAAERVDCLRRTMQANRRARDDKTPGDRKFDFLYAPTLRGCSTELSSVLSLHPAAFAVPKTELDLALAGYREAALLGKYQRQLLDRHHDIFAGLVQHAFIANQLAGEDVARRLAAVTTRRLFIHGVREPLSLLISAFNHQLIALYGGAYRFAPVCGDTPFDGPRRTITGIRGYASRLVRRPKVTPRTLEIDPDSIEGLLDVMLSMARHHAVGRCYAQHFDTWLPVNLVPRSSRRHLAQELFAAFGLDEHFYHPAFAVSEGTPLHRLMVQNFIMVKAFGHTIPLGIGFAGRMHLSNTFPLGEIFWAPPSDDFPSLGAAIGLCVTTARESWQTLPRKVRRKLVESNQVLDFCNRTLLPAWLESYAAWRVVFQDHLLREASPSLRRRLVQRIGRDLECFLMQHPSFEQQWPTAVDLVGS
jgi:hypothetical protein